MIAFIIPLKSKQVSKDWDHVIKLLERCVNSIVNQTSEKFEVIIVCHERPKLEMEHPSINYVEVDFLPPILGQKDTIKQMDWDKNQKMWTGMKYAERMNPSHIMFVDADDCVSCHITEFVNQNAHVNGWFFDSGYVYEDGSDRIYYKRKNFYLMSGTSHIVKYALLQDETVHSAYLSSSKPLHQFIIDILAENKTPLKPLPFAGAVYIVGTGENIYADKNSDRPNRGKLKLSSLKKFLLAYPRRFKTLLNSRSLSESIKREFSLKLGY